MRKWLRLTSVVIMVFFLSSFGAAAQGASPLTRFYVTPLELDFGPVGVGITSPQMKATITNTGLYPLTGWTGGGVGAPFAASQNCNIGGGILPGNSCQYTFTFTPTTAGPFSATSTSTTSAGPFSVILHGAGVGAVASYDAHALDFGNIYTNGSIAGTAPTQVVTITNTGLAPLTGWAGGGVSAPFGASQDCNIAGGVLPGHSCHYTFTFSTASWGSFTATSSTGSNGGPVTVALSGRSHGSILAGGGQKITPISLDFGPVGVGTTSVQMMATITNQSLLSNITDWVGGGVGAPFGASQDCNITGGLPAGSSCHFNYTFKPTAAGPFSADSNVSDSFGSFSVHLQGTGVAPSLTANSLWQDFGPVALGGSGTQQTVTITNTGRSPLTNWAGGGVGAPFSASQDCNIPGGVLPGASCHFFYNFSPTAPGFYTASSSFSTNAGPVMIKLQGGTFIPLFLPFIHK